jgi:hypothetical protein
MWLRPWDFQNLDELASCYIPIGFTFHPLTPAILLFWDSIRQCHQYSGTAKQPEME